MPCDPTGVTADRRDTAPPLALVLGDPGPGVAERLEALRGLADIVSLPTASAAHRAAAEILLVWDFRSRSLDAVVRDLPALRWLHAASAGLEHILVPAIIEGDFVVTRAAGFFDEPMAEYVAALVLAHAKQLQTTIAAQHERRWVHREAATVAGRTMAVVGMGQIGRAVGRTAHALGMEVVGVRRSGQGHPEDPTGTRILAGPREAAAVADYLVVTAALTPETHNLVSADVLAGLRPEAYLINIARSQIVDQEALVAMLCEGRLAGAALDVFDREPLPADSPLWEVPNLLISPHMSGDTIGYTLELMDEFGDQLRRYRRGEPLLHVVDVRRGY